MVSEIREFRGSAMIKVIHVEDDDDIRELVGLSLDVAGDFELMSFASGMEAIQAVEVFGPDLVLLDMMMPNINGIDTLKAIKQIEGYAEIPAIFVTARVDGNQNEAFLDAGALEVIVKPFDPIELGAEIKEIFKSVSTLT
jgi:DNA-binding response OmpR family regulator